MTEKGKTRGLEEREEWKENAESLPLCQKRVILGVLRLTFCQKRAIFRFLARHSVKKTESAPNVADILSKWMDREKKEGRGQVLGPGRGVRRAPKLISSWVQQFIDVSVLHLTYLCPIVLPSPCSSSCFSLHCGLFIGIAFARKL